MYKHVHTRLNDLRTRLYHGLYIPCTYHVHTCIYICRNDIHVSTCLCFSIIVYTMSVSCFTIGLYIHCTYMVQTCLYTFIPDGQDSRCRLKGTSLMMMAAGARAGGPAAVENDHVIVEDTRNSSHRDSLSGCWECWRAWDFRVSTGTLTGNSKRSKSWWLCIYMNATKWDIQCHPLCRTSANRVPIMAIIGSGYYYDAIIANNRD